MPVTGKNMTIWFYAYVELIEIKTKTVNIVHFPYLDLSQNVKIRDVPYSLKSPRNTECKLAHIYGMNKAGADPGGGGRTRRAPPLKIGKNKIFWRKIVIFTRNTPTFFAPPSARRNFFKCVPLT